MESMHRGVWHTVTSQGMDPNYEGLLLLELKMSFIEFPGGSVVKTPPSNAGLVGSITGQRTKVLHATWGGQKLKRKKCHL